MTSPDAEPAPPSPEGDDAPAKQPVWWVAVPALVGAYAGYGLLRGDTGSIWPWGDIAVLVVALVLLGVVLAPRLRSGRRP